MNIFTTKACSRCGEVLPLDKFYRSKGKSDGRDCYCAACRLSIQKSPKVKAQLREISARHREKHPERESARQIADRAIRTGQLTKQPCLICGSEEVQAHHENYLRPLKVVFLCPKHHQDYHLVKASAEMETV